MLRTFLACLGIVGVGAPFPCDASDKPQRLSLATEDQATIVADQYGAGERGVVLAHGARFNKESWEKQARVLADAGFRVVAIDFRGYGTSRGPGQDNPLAAPLHLDILAAVGHLRGSGAKTVAVIGGSMGGAAAADATAHAQAGEIDCLVVLGAVAGKQAAEKIKGRKLFIVSRDEASAAGPRLPQFRAQFAQVAEPKRLIVLDGSAHAQNLFETAQSERVMREIVDFLRQPQP
jgi:pimeloyl-ACP methyl ester carboxylesterase